jgi:hypothetical protein
MRIVRQTEDALIVESDGRVVAGVFLVCFIAFAVFAGVKYFTDANAVHGESFQGALGAALMGLLGFLAVFERSTFDFDGRARALHWHRQRAFRRRAGVVAFGEIQAVVAQRPIADDGIPSRRVVLRLAGEELPLSIGYDSDGDGRCLRLAEAIRQFVGLPMQDDLMASVQAAVNRGNGIEAVRLLREERQLSLTEAKRLVDSIRDSAAAGKENA